VALVLLFFLPSAGSLSWFEMRAAAALFGRPPRAPPFPRAGLIAALSASLLFAVMPFGRYVVLADLDIAILLATALAALATIGALTGGVRSALQLVSFLLPATLALGAVVVMAGSPRVDDIVRAQGPGPWDWFALRSPATLLLFVVHLSAAFAQTSMAPPELAEADGDAVPIARGPFARVAAMAAEWACVVVTCGSSAALFLGGWQLPGVALSQQHNDLYLELVGSAVFLAKAAVLFAATVWARRALPVVRPADAVRFCWRWLVPLAALGLGIALAELVWSPGGVVLRAMTLATCVLAGLAILRVAYGVRFAARTHPELPVDPFV
jgi:NADH-quinone oxidoreductase subunit H